MMSAAATFRRALEGSCGIIKWAPSDQQLKEIARRFVAKKPSTLGAAAGIVTDVVPGTLFIVNEGLDNSDLRALLALAGAAATHG